MMAKSPPQLLLSFPGGPSTQHLRSLAPKTISGMVLEPEPQILGTWTFWVSFSLASARDAKQGKRQGPRRGASVSRLLGGTQTASIQTSSRLKRKPPLNEPWPKTVFEALRANTGMPFAYTTERLGLR